MRPLRYFVVSLVTSSGSFMAPRNSRAALPNVLPNRGSLFGPKTNSTITAITGKCID